MKLIRNAKALILGQLKEVDVLFDETIRRIVPRGTEISGIDEPVEIIDASGKTLLPGLVDVHVHLREPGHAHKETIKTGTKAAAAGGFTTIFAMPNVLPFPSTPEVMKNYQARIENDSLVHTYPYGTITINESGKEIVDYAAMKKLGIEWFSDDGVGVADDEVMKKAMISAKENDVLFACHTEDMKYRKPQASVHESAFAKEHGWIGIPSACEYAQLARDLDLVREIGSRYHACHISAKESVELIAQAKMHGCDVSGEVTAHHLLLEAEDVQGTNWKMNPPLRSHEDRMALIEGLEQGKLDFIASDHAPHTAAEKERPMDQAPFGIVSLETSFVLLYTEFVHKQKRWSLAQLVDWMSATPARRFGLDGIGEIRIGMNADLFLADLDNEYTIHAQQFESMGKNTPFDGMKVHAAICQTFINGQSVWKGNEE
ncbi:dihydroorotase [uncultured Dubosiella sp.]|uniref:dihydroorotase n=1 Tax=uncultured Dubosiella sp. TaxID=1937011 RepID=UPI0026026284|nr:dihydroorotase [uncultured Dubosiella sp.]